METKINQINFLESENIYLRPFMKYDENSKKRVCGGALQCVKENRIKRPLESV